jgi:cell division protein FtsQ
MKRHRVLRIAVWLAALTVVALPLVAATNGWLAADRWPFRQLIVNGAFDRVSVDQVRAQTLPALKAGYFAVDLDVVRERVAALPWVEHAEVRKRWPDRIEVTVSEREPFARFGGERVLSLRGDLFTPPAGTLPDHLPHFTGPEGARVLMRDFYQKASQTLTATGLQPAGAHLSNRGAWRLLLANGGELVLGRERAEARLARFAAVYAELADADPERLLRADLRYENGFALQWSPLVVPDSPPATAPSTPPASADPLPQAVITEPEHEPQA